MKIVARIKKALYFAAEAHDGQYRKGTRVPYITHPMLVAYAVRKFSDDEDIYVAALLHDVIEDCANVCKENLRDQFGDRIAKIVDEVSYPCEKKYSSWKEKKETYLKKLKTASSDALLVAGADKMVNMQAYFDVCKKDGGRDIVAKHFNATMDEYFWYYGAVGDILEAILSGENMLVREYRELLDYYKEACEQ